MQARQTAAGVAALRVIGAGESVQSAQTAAGVGATHVIAVRRGGGSGVQIRRRQRIQPFQLTFNPPKRRISGAGVTIQARQQAHGTGIVFDDERVLGLDDQSLLGLAA
jgi:hypothetical protein